MPRPANDDPNRADTAEKNGRTNRGPMAWTLLDTTDSMLLWSTIDDLLPIYLMKMMLVFLCFDYYSFDVMIIKPTFVPHSLPSLNDASPLETLYQ